LLKMKLNKNTLWFQAIQTIGKLLSLLISRAIRTLTMKMREFQLCLIVKNLIGRAVITQRRVSKNMRPMTKTTMVMVSNYISVLLATGNLKKTRIKGMLKYVRMFLLRRGRLLIHRLLE